jgi:hypothetical protein
MPLDPSNAFFQRFHRLVEDSALPASADWLIAGDFIMPFS